MASLPTIATPAFLSKISSFPNLPPQVWYFVTGVTLSIINRPDEISRVYEYAVNHEMPPKDSKPTHEDQLRISRRMREALIKAGAVGGLPKSINALLELKKVTPVEFQDRPLAYSPTSRAEDIYDVPSSQILRRGQTFFDKIYGKVSKRVMGQMDRSGTEDLGLTARLLYGHLLSNTTVLDSAESSFVLIAGLIPQDVNPQLKGHLRGACNGGATVEEVKAVRGIVIKICQEYGMRRLEEGVTAGWGWRDDIADL